MNEEKRLARAKQFAPFAALRGYYDMIRSKQRRIQPRREMSEDYAEELSRKMQQVRKGSMVRIIHYDHDGYIVTEGSVSRLDTDFRSMTIVKTVISLDDIWLLRADGQQLLSSLQIIKIPKVVTFTISITLAMVTTPMER